MKEASGELNMTVITIVAIAAVGALFYFFVWPIIQRSLVSQTCKTAYGTDWNAVKATTNNINDGSNAKVGDWMCCPNGDGSSSSCVKADR